MKVYLASPKFNKSQAQAVDLVEEILRELGIDNYSPFRDGITLHPDATRDEKTQVFKSNTDSIDDCDVMIAIIDDRDTGTTFEIGYFYSKWKSMNQDAELGDHPALIFFLSQPKDNISVMLTEAGSELCIGRDELVTCLTKLLDLNTDGGPTIMNRNHESFDRVLTH